MYTDTQWHKSIHVITKKKLFWNNMFQKPREQYELGTSIAYMIDDNFFFLKCLLFVKIWKDFSFNLLLQSCLIIFAKILDKHIVFEMLVCKKQIRAEYKRFSISYYFLYNRYFSTFQNMIQIIVIVERQTISQILVIMTW